MNIYEDIRKNAGVIDQKQYINEELIAEAIFIGGKVLFKNSKRLMRFSTILKKKIEKEEKKSAKKGKPPVDMDILIDLRDECFDASKLFFDLEAKYESAMKKENREQIKILYNKGAVKYKRILLILKKDETKKALLWIGIGALAVVLALSIGQFLSVDIQNFLGGKTEAGVRNIMSGDKQNIDNEISDLVQDQENAASFITNPKNAFSPNMISAAKFVVDSEQEIATKIEIASQIRTNVDAVTSTAKNVGLGIVSASAIGAFFGKLRKTKDVDQAKEIALSLSKSKEK